MRAVRMACLLACAFFAACGGPGGARTLADGGSASQGSSVHQMLLTPDAGRLYHGVLPRGTTEPDSDVSPANLDGYESAVGRRVAWVYFSTDWFRSRAFPEHTASWVRDRGAVPFIRLMMRASRSRW